MATQYELGAWISWYFVNNFWIGCISTCFGYILQVLQGPPQKGTQVLDHHVLHLALGLELGAISFFQIQAWVKICFDSEIW